MFHWSAPKDSPCPSKSGEAIPKQSGGRMDVSKVAVRVSTLSDRGFLEDGEKDGGEAILSSPAGRFGFGLTLGLTGVTEDFSGKGFESLRNTDLKKFTSAETIDGVYLHVELGYELGRTFFRKPGFLSCLIGYYVNVTIYYWRQGIIGNIFDPKKKQGMFAC